MPVQFVDRVAELERLDSLVVAATPGLAAIWGRRRVGKTRLLLEWCRRHAGLYTVADLSAEPLQRRYLADALSSRFPGFSDVEYPDWRTLLRALAREAQRSAWRGPLVLDEFPYLVESSPALPSVLQSLVDHEARDAGLVTVICGSTQHLMQGLALGPEAPLFGRMLAAIALGPMSPRALGEALRIPQPRDCVRAFGVWGGIPRYWELAEPFGGRLDEAVERLVLEPMGPLHLEPDRLLMEERPPALAVRPLLDAIGGGAHRVSEIAGRLGVPATSLARGLARLVELGLVRREQPFGESGRGGKRSLYVIADPFFRLWFRLVAPHRALLASGTDQTRLALWRKHRGALLAQAWEDLCREAVPRLDPDEGPLAGWGGWTPAGRFWAGAGPEWDVVARSLDGHALLLGEVKWRDEAVTREGLARACQELVQKGVPPVRDTRDDVAIIRAVFVPEIAGRRPTLPHDCRVVVAADVVKALG
jgi:AAA+ ATPase superfamily predicted ATPase